MTSLKRAALKGTAWSTLSTVMNRGLRFLITIVLARLLAPADFGLIAMATFFMDVAELLNDLGLGAALIQRKTLERQHLNTCFWANIGLGALLWGVTVLAAPLVSGFYHQPALVPVLSVMALNFLLAPLGSIPWVLLNRELRFKELMIAQSIATAVRGGTALVLAWQGAGVWSLVWGPLAGTVAGSIVNWGFCRWRPQCAWSQRHFNDLFHFGRNVFGEKLLGYFAGNTDALIIGRVLGATTLGYYNFAYQLPRLAQLHAAPIVTRVLLPVLSQVQDDRARLRRGYLLSLQWIAVLAAPFTVGLLVAAPEFIPVVYGARWQPVVAPLQILCLAGLAQALTTTVWTVQQAMGRPDIGLRWNLGTLPLVLVTLLVAARGGILSIAWAMLALTVGLSLAIQHITNRLMGLTWAAWLNAVKAPVLAAVVMGLVVEGARWGLREAGAAAGVILTANIALGVASYALLLFGGAPRLRAQLKEMRTLTAKGAA